MDPKKGFGCRVFTPRVMREKLPREVWERLEEATHLGGALDPAIAQAVADAMKEWALEQGATHFTHWFQPMTGITAGKLDAFLTPDGEGGAVTEFSGKALCMGEPDASSFPSGGLRATFEARGYTAWDPTSPAFVKDNTLYIPTAFCAYTGQALDAKTPLLRSTEAVSREAARFCHAIGMDQVTRVEPSVGAEQEYFLIDRAAYDQRLDLKLCGTTLMGAPMPKGQELDDHYLGRIRLRVSRYMEEVDRRLWELGVPSKTRHNEVAPAQHELAPVFESCNVACDHNQLVMEVLRQVAKEQGLACLLHEKPFARVNGSGKHNNYSLTTDTGVNLLSPGPEPEKNLRFLLTICAFLRGVDSYPELLRLSTACAGNDHRLGGNEAPPAVISVFLGDALLDALRRAAGEEAESHRNRSLSIGVATSPELLADDSDRNRTSPFAFTGNKFEFRMVGASQSIAFANTVLNTILADSFNAFAIYFEEEGFSPATVRRVIDETLRAHGRVVFNGDNYTARWAEEAESRGLPVIGDTVEALKALEDEKNWKLLGRFGVLTPAECASHQEIMTENYNNVVNIQASVMVQMARRQVLPAVSRHLGETAAQVRDFSAVMGGRGQGYLEDQLERLSDLVNAVANGVDSLERDLDTLPEDPRERAAYMRDVVLRDMAELRDSCDRSEAILPKDLWPMPSYTRLVHFV